MTARKTALVTGGAGFIGRHMCDELERRGWAIISVDLLPTMIPLLPIGAGGRVTAPRASHLHVITDVRDFIRDLDRPRDTVYGPMSGDSARYDLIIHSAYHVGGRAAIDGLNDNFVKNVELDAQLFAWAIRTQQPHVLYFSSSSVYPLEYQSEEYAAVIDEDCRDWTLHEYDRGVRDGCYPDCDADYGWAKYVGECLAEKARENGVKVTVVRPFSGYGEDQSLDYPFPSFIQRALRREDPFTIWGSAEQARDFIHVDDVIRGALAVADSKETRPVNLCTGVTTSMRDLAQLMCRTVGYDPAIEVLRSKPMGVFHRVGNPQRFKKYYQPTVTLEEGVRRALEGGKRD